MKLFAECHRFTHGKHINGWTRGTLFAECFFSFIECQICRVFMHIFAEWKSLPSVSTEGHSTNILADVHVARSLPSASLCKVFFSLLASAKSCGVFMRVFAKYKYLPSVF